LVHPFSKNDEFFGRIYQGSQHKDLRGVMVEAAWVAVEHHLQRISPV